MRGCGAAAGRGGVVTGAEIFGFDGALGIAMCGSDGAFGGSGCHDGIAAFEGGRCGASEITGGERTLIGGGIEIGPSIRSASAAALLPFAPRVFQ